MIKLHIIKAKRNNKEKYYFISDNDDYGYGCITLNDTISDYLNNVDILYFIHLKEYFSIEKYEEYNTLEELKFNYLEELI